MAPEKPLRVAQWATGNIGSWALRAVLEHPALELVGLYVHSDDKAGRDAGELCGAGTTGIKATRDIEDIVALKPDCVLYMPLLLDADHVCRLLASGANVVTTRGEFHHPGSMDPALRKRIEAACAEGGTSIHSTGSSPGFITEAVPLPLMSIQRKVTDFTIDEYANVSIRDSPDMLFGIMGFGQAPTDFDDGRLTHAEHSFGPSLRLLAEAMSVPLDELKASGDVGVATETVKIAAGTIPEGTVGAQRIMATGFHAGKPLLHFRATWYCTKKIDKDWVLGDNGWHISIDSDCPLEIDLKFPTPLEHMAEVTPGYTANRAVNAVDVVCAAPAGIRTTVDLPQIITKLA